MVVWNGSRPSLGVGAASHAPRPPSRRCGAGARLHEIDDFGLSRRARRVEADGVDEERSQLLPWLELGGRGVARGQRVPPHPLYLPVPVPTRSYERRVFARASTLSLRTSQPLGSLHNSAYSRSGGHSKTAIPSQRASKRINLASPRAIRFIECRRSSFKHQRSFLSRFLKTPRFVVPRSTNCTLSKPRAWFNARQARRCLRHVRPGAGCDMNCDMSMM